MKKLLTSALALLLGTLGLCQNYQRFGASQSRSAALPFDEQLAPFYHGVASGDPLSDRVIIWTRYTSETEGSFEISYVMATDTALSNVVAEGLAAASASTDYTIKVDVTNLEPGTTYYYQFIDEEGKKSLIGRTRTAPEGAVDQLRFAVVSCSNYDAGYFNAYGRIAERNDLDAVIHLGDYIYEYGDNYYGDSTLTERVVHPDKEILQLLDYRTRYSLYKLDPDLIKIHQQHPIIAVWDDHESANDAYMDGAENHTDSTEGSWDVRKKTAIDVYFEWMPIRENADSSIYRKIQYGDLMDLIMVDTRLEGREEQIYDVSNPLLYAPDRTVLGAEQKAWFLQNLENSSAKWKVIGNQIIFSEFNVGWAGPATGQTPAQLESQFLDIWDGYPAERDSIIEFIDQNEIDNVIWLTGDFHSTFAFDVAKRPSVFAYDFPAVQPTYNPQTGEGSVAVEFATPSITSANFDENIGIATAAAFEYQMNNPITSVPDTNPIYGVTPNPHLIYTDLDQHGYFILDLKEDSAQADWYFVETIKAVSDVENFGQGVTTLDAMNKLKIAGSAAVGKPIQQIPAPYPQGTVNGINKESVHLFEIYPIPSNDYMFVSFVANRSGELKTDLITTSGRVIQSSQQSIAAGLFQSKMDISSLSPGVYVMKLTLEDRVKTKTFVVK